jgi:hypothetical protein
MLSDYPDTSLTTSFHMISDLLALQAANVVTLNDSPMLSDYPDTSLTTSFHIISDLLALQAANVVTLNDSPMLSDYPDTSLTPPFHIISDLWRAHCGLPQLATRAATTSPTSIHTHAPACSFRTRMQAAPQIASAMGW